MLSGLPNLSRILSQMIQGKVNSLNQNRLISQTCVFLIFSKAELSAITNTVQNWLLRDENLDEGSTFHSVLHMQPVIQRDGLTRTCISLTA